MCQFVAVAITGPAPVQSAKSRMASCLLTNRGCQVTFTGDPLMVCLLPDLVIIGFLKRIVVFMCME
eukprot:766813-Hanusia_phi.AAC.3